MNQDDKKKNDTSKRQILKDSWDRVSELKPSKPVENKPKDDKKK